MSAADVTKLLKSKRNDAEEQIIALFPNMTDEDIMNLAVAVRGSDMMLLDCEVSAELVRRGLPTDDDLGARWLDWLAVFEGAKHEPILVSDGYPDEYEAAHEVPALRYVTPATLLGTTWRSGILGGFGWYPSTRKGILDWLFESTGLVPVEVVLNERILNVT